MNKKDCQHVFRLFHDKNLVGKGYLSFYCRKCLMLKKIKKEYDVK